MTSRWNSPSRDRGGTALMDQGTNCNGLNSGKAFVSSKKAGLVDSKTGRSCSSKITCSPRQGKLKNRVITFDFSTSQ